jgi:hypothetical protein
VNNAGETIAKRLEVPGPEGMMHRALFVLTGGILAVSVICVGSGGPVEAKDNAAHGPKSPALEGSGPNSAAVPMEKVGRALGYWTPQRILTLVANIIALLALGWKLAYDRWWNSGKFNRETERAGEDREALFRARERRRDRAEWSAAITFLALAVSYTLFIIQGLLP